ncbi:MAG: hypothetical protein ACP5RP_02760 [Candidatus Micrarchaeia archaeon]
MQKESVSKKSKEFEPTTFASSESKSSQSFQEKKPVKIMIVGEIGGGTKYFDERALLGLYHMLKSYSNASLPDYLIFNGGVLPEIPKYATKGSADKLHIIEEGINNMDDAVIAVKPSLNRIMSMLKERNAKTTVIYVMSPEDRANIKNRNYERLIGAYNNSPEVIQELKEAYISKINSNEFVLSNLKESQKANETTKEVDMAEYERKAKYLKKKIAEVLDQIYDYSLIVKQYEKLQISWIREHPEKSAVNDDKAKELFGEKDKWSKSLYEEKEEALIKTYKSAADELKSIDPKKYPEKYKKVEGVVKEIEGMIEGLSYKTIRDAKKAADKFSAESPVKTTGDIFTGNLKASRDVQEIARNIANMEISSHIKDAFGRKYPITILQAEEPEYAMEPLLYSIISSKKINMLIANNPTNVSSLFSSNPKNSLERILKIPMQKPGIDLVIGGHSIIAEVEAVPQVNNGKCSYLILSPPFIKIDKLAELWKLGIKTPYTMAYEKSKFKMSSGIWEIAIGENKNSFTYHLNEEFLDFYMKEAAEQRGALVEKLHLYAAEEDGRKHGKLLEKLGEELGDFSRKLWLEHKMPSEWNDSIIKEFLRESGIKETDYAGVNKLANIIEGKDKVTETKFIRAMKFVDKHFPEAYSNIASKEIKINGVSDSHIGGAGRGFYAPQELLQGFIRKTVDDPPDILVFGGDMLDANYKNFSSEKSQDTDYYTNLPEFVEFIKGKVPKGQERIAIDRYISRAGRQIDNISDQHRIFVQSINALNNIPDKKKPAIWLVSGNHYNGRFEARDDDEAIKLSISFSSPQYKLTIVPGGDYGIGTASFNGVKFMLRHSLTPKIFDSLRVSNDTTGAFVGHAHKFDFIVKGDQFIANIPASAYVNSFPEQIGIPASEDLRGFSRYKIFLRGEKPIKFTSEFISQAQLEDEGYIKTDAIDRLIQDFVKMKRS